MGQKRSGTAKETPGVLGKYKEVDEMAELIGYAAIFLAVAWTFFVAGYCVGREGRKER